MTPITSKPEFTAISFLLSMVFKNCNLEKYASRTEPKCKE